MRAPPRYAQNVAIDMYARSTCAAILPIELQFGSHRMEQPTIALTQTPNERACAFGVHLDPALRVSDPVAMHDALLWRHPRRRRGAPGAPPAASARARATPAITSATGTATVAATADAPRSTGLDGPKRRRRRHFKTLWMVTIPRGGWVVVGVSSVFCCGVVECSCTLSCSTTSGRAALASSQHPLVRTRARVEFDASVVHEPDRVPSGCAQTAVKRAQVKYPHNKGQARVSSSSIF